MTSWRTVVSLLVPLALAVLIVVAAGRRVSGFLRLRLRWPVLLWLAAAVRLLRFLDPAWLPGWMRYRDGSFLIVVCWIAGTAWVLLNCRRGRPAATAAMLTTFGGFTINTAVILVNFGTMPFSVRSARWSGSSDAAIEQRVVGHAQLDGRHRLWWLSDVVPVPGLEKVVSIGDLVMVAGIVGILVTGVGIGDAAAPRRRVGRGGGDRLRRIAGVRTRGAVRNRARGPG